jgi:hypothetical protein
LYDRHRRAPFNFFVDLLVDGAVAFMACSIRASSTRCKTRFNLKTAVDFSV